MSHRLVWVLIRGLEIIQPEPLLLPDVLGVKPYVKSGGGIDKYTFFTVFFKTYLHT